MIVCPTIRLFSVYSRSDDLSLGVAIITGLFSKLLIRICHKIYIESRIEPGISRSVSLQIPIEQGVTKIAKQLGNENMDKVTVKRKKTNDYNIAAK